MSDDRPYVLVSVATSLDGYIDDSSAERLLLSNAADFDRVDAVRASVDAILVGPGTIRTDNPRLLVRSAHRRAQRCQQGLPESPVKVTMSNSGQLDPRANFFTTGNGEKLVYTVPGMVIEMARHLDGVATVVAAGDPLRLDILLSNLATRGISRLLVEGGTVMHTMFLTAGVVDELHLVIAPFFVGDLTAPRFVKPGQFPQSPEEHLTLTEVRQIGDLAFLRYLQNPRERPDLDDLPG